MTETLIDSPFHRPPWSGRRLPGAEDTETVHDARAGGAGGTRRQGPKAAPSTSGHDRPATKARLALPGDLGRSLRLLDDDALDRLVKAAIEQVRRREHDVPHNSLDESRQSKRPETKTEASDRVDSVTPRQKRPIPAASLRPSCGNCGSRGRPSNMLSPPRKAQGGAIDDRWTQVDRRAPGFERARFRREDVRSVQRTAESRSGLGLRRSGRPRPARYDRTGRNVIVARQCKPASGSARVERSGNRSLDSYSAL